MKIASSVSGAILALLVVANDINARDGGQRMTL